MGVGGGGQAAVDLAPFQQDDLALAGLVKNSRYGKFEDEASQHPGQFTLHQSGPSRFPEHGKDPSSSSPDIGSDDGSSDSDGSDDGSDDGNNNESNVDVLSVNSGSCEAMPATPAVAELRDHLEPRPARKSVVRDMLKALGQKAPPDVAAHRRAAKPKKS